MTATAHELVLDGEPDIWRRRRETDW
jgi:hypothetical protein